jgi:hypothetical protein
MMRRTFGLAGIFMLLTLSACSDRLPSIKYRMTVELETPQGPRSSYSIVEIDPKVFTTLQSTGGVDVKFNIKAEAVAIDLPRHGTLFALLRTNDLGDSDLLIGSLQYAGLHVSPEGTAADHWRRVFSALANSDAKWELPPNRLPMFVRFQDLADPTSIEVVDPLHLDRAYGPGFRLKRVMIEIVKEPGIRGGIVARLPWLKGLHTTLDGSQLTTSNKPANYLSSIDFVREH